MGCANHVRGIAVILASTIVSFDRNGYISQRSLQDAPIFRLLLKVAVKGTHQCDFLNFLGDSWFPTLLTFC